MDVNSLSRLGDTSSVHTAKASFDPTQSDEAWTVEDVELRCEANQYRIVTATPFDADGTPLGSPEPVDETFDTIAPNGLSGYLKGVVCDGQRANPPYYPSIQAWIAAGRK